MADQWAKHLADKGFSAIAFPSREWRLLTLAFEWNSARGHDNSFDILAPGVAASLPAPELGGDLPEISGERTRTLDLSLGLKILSGLIGALGGGTLGVSAGFKNAKKITFSYEGITTSTLSPVVIQQKLNAIAPPTSGLLKDWLDDNLYLVVSVVAAKKFSVTAHSETNAEVKIDVPVISGAVGANVGVKASGSNDSTVTFEGATPVPFAVKLFKVTTAKINGQRRLTLKTVKSGIGALESVLGATDASLDVDLPIIDGFDEGSYDEDPTAIVLPWSPETETDRLSGGDQ